jgi:hypothetical protein
MWNLKRRNKTEQLLERRLLPDKNTVWSWLKRLNAFGPRLTGNAAHRNAIEFLHSELEATGLKVFRDTLRMTHWEAKAYDLIVHSPNGSGESLEVTSCFPYSGATTAEGVEGELVYYRIPPRSFAAATGKIALVEISVPSLPRLLMRLAFRARTRVPDRSADFGSWFTSPLLSMGFLPNLGAAARAGVLGLVCIWRRCSNGNAAYQYLPFITPYQGCPALWVGGAVGDRLMDLARRGGRIKFKLDATIEPVEVDTLYAVLPGTDAAETIIVNTHTDGPNACEENGPVALLTLARYFAGFNQTQRRRTMIFVLVTGHFQLPQLPVHGQATSTWLSQHRDLWAGHAGQLKAVAGVTAEHLGAMEWKDDDSFVDFRPTRRPELELVYTANPTLDRIYVDALDERTITRTMTLRPVNDIYFGEGEPLFQAGIPTISMIAIPDYLCAAPPSGYIEKLDLQLFYEQIETLAKVLTALDSTPAPDIGKPQRQPWGLVRILVKLARIYLAYHRVLQAEAFPAGAR